MMMMVECGRRKKSFLKTKVTSFAVLLFVFLLERAASLSTYNKSHLESIKAKSYTSTTNRFILFPPRRELAFGDYSEVPDTCPALTTCQPICVAQEADCPTSCEAGYVLCNDGTCSNTSCDPEAESPCIADGCEDFPFACANVIDYLDSCQEKYGDQYDALAACNEAVEDAVPQVSFTGPWFLFCYYWLVAVTVLVFCWCAYNQNISVQNSVQTLHAVSTSLPMARVSSSGTIETHSEWSLTGYKQHLIGSFINLLVWTTLWGFQFLLFLLTIFYYMQQEAITRWAPVFYDEVQVLKAFQMVWFIGLLWSLSFQWPESIGSLFLRRCALVEATHVAVFAPLKKVDVTATSRNFEYGHYFSRILWFPFEAFLRFVFSYPHSNPDYETLFCKVDHTETAVPSFYCRMCRYVYNETEGKFIPGSMNVGTTIGALLEQRSGLTTHAAEQNFQLVGPNVIPLTKPTFGGCVLKEFSKSFYVYQNFMVWTWYPYWYYYMALVQTVVRLVAGTVVAVFQYKSDLMLYQLSVVEGTVDVLRDNARVTISVKDVVPGDVVVLQSGTVLCDMVIVKSKHLVVDENAVTGESTPIAKDELDATMSKITYDPIRHKVHTLFAGTDIIECGDDEDELGLVLATGSFTAKGKLLSDILSYERHKFLFDDEIKIVLFILVLQATILITLVFQWLEDQFVYAFFYGVFILGTVIPPLLPTVFVVSVGISADRLNKQRITCINPENILVAGKVNVCCFDKTGTLTEQSMECVGVECATDELEQLTKLGMSVCHGLKETASGELIGNHVDKATFTNSTAAIEFQKSQNVVIVMNGRKYTILKQYEFDNHRQTQCVIVRSEDGSKHIFVKGSPEAIRRRCNAESIPKTFEETLKIGANSGLYQLAIAHKEHYGEDHESVARDDLETSLSFCGFISFRNQLKKETAGLIEELKEGNLLITMITGDNVLTGICIGKESGMCCNEELILGQLGSDESIEWVNVVTNEIVDKPMNLTKAVDLAMTGDAWELLLKEERDYALTIAKHVRVFGRCNPSHKVSVVTTLVQMGYITLMCGDGQNDCGALKSAHVGIALSSSDASVVAPFTSVDKTVTSVSVVLKEGRCALSSAFKAYSYYIMYGQVETYLQTINANLFITFSEWCWFFLDGVYSSSMAFSLPLAHAASKLTPRRPTASLLGARTMFSVCGMLAFNFLFIVIALIALNQQDWYQCRKWNSEDVSSVTTIGDNYETSTLYVVGAYQYISSAVALNFGYTFRAAWWKNYVFVFLVTAFTIIHFTATLYPSNLSCLWRVNCDNSNVVVSITGGGAPRPINNPFNTTVMPMEFRIILVAIMVSNLICLCSWEYFFVNGYLYMRCKFGKDEPLDHIASPPELTSAKMEKSAA